jgi:hypothetical protein
MQTVESSNTGTQSKVEALRSESAVHANESWSNALSSTESLSIHSSKTRTYAKA